MKSTVKYLICVAVLLVVSCTEPSDMLTVIKADGSCYREFSEYPDSAFLAGDFSERHNPFSSNIDSTWEFAWKYKNSGLKTNFPINKSVYDSIYKTPDNKIEGHKTHNNILVFARKNYKSVEEMDSTFQLKSSNEWSSLKISHCLVTKFRWFYTYYTYRETYPKIETRFKIPLEKYVTHDEAMYWFTGVPNVMLGMNGVEMIDYGKAVENKLRQWFNQNLWNAEFEFLLTNYDEMKNKPMSYERLANLKDTIFKAKVNQAEEFKMEHILDDYFKTDVFTAFWKSDDSPMEKYEKDLNDQGFINYFGKTFTYKLVLPGKIVQPNNAIVQGDTMIWRLTAYRMIPEDYVIEAQSRKANVWAFILTGIIAIIAIGSFLWKPKRA